MVKIEISVRADNKRFVLCIKIFKTFYTRRAQTPAKPLPPKVALAPAVCSAIFLNFAMAQIPLIFAGPRFLSFQAPAAFLIQSAV